MCIISNFIFNYEENEQIGPAWSRYYFSKQQCFVPNLRRQALLTAADLPRSFDLGEEKVHPYFKENKYGIFDWILSGLNVDLLDSLVPNRENQTTGSIFFIQAICFPFIPYNSNYYIFDSHSGYSFGQSSENVYSILLQFVTIEHVLNFVTTSYLIENQLQYIYENQSVFCFSKRHYDGNVIIFKNEKYNHDFITKINTNVSSFD